MGDPMGERGGLARSGAGNDEKRPGFEAEPAAMFDGTTLLWIEVFQARPLPSATGSTGFSDRAAARGGRGLESVRTEPGLNHDSPFVRNVVMCDVARPGRFVINHQTNRLSLAALENRSRTSGFLRIGGANEEVCFGVTVRCGGSRHATGYCSRAWRALFQGHEVVRMREASRRHVSMLQSHSQVRLFTRPARLQALTTSAAGR
jgi:hypothetical protein